MGGPARRGGLIVWFLRSSIAVPWIRDILASDMDAFDFDEGDFLDGFREVTQTTEVIQ